MTVKATQFDHERMMYNITCVYRDADKTQHAEGLFGTVSLNARRITLQ